MTEVNNVFKQFWGNWFYTLAYQRTIVLMLILFSTYTAVVFFYAAIYLFVSQIGQKQNNSDDSSSTTGACFCDMDIHDHMEALYFSLSTMTTIGYGVSDYYFGGCWTPLLLIITQICTAITFDAVAIGLLFQRISRGQKRGKTVLFSDKAVVRRVRGRWYLQFRIAELRRHQLLEATVRAYCVRQERQLVGVSASAAAAVASSSTNAISDGNNNTTESNAPPSPPAATTTTLQTTHFVTRPMKLQHEDVSSHILMSLPQVIVHAIDERSPLHPPASWYDAQGEKQLYHPPAVISNVEGEQRSIKDGDDKLAMPNKSTLQQGDESSLERFVQDRETEIIVLVEGTDELTGAVIQTRHSYTYCDLAWNQSFLPCVIPYTDGIGDDVDETDDTEDERAGLRFLRRGRDSQNRRSPATATACVIDFAKFHETAVAPANADDCPYVVG